MKIIKIIAISLFCLCLLNCSKPEKSPIETYKYQNGKEIKTAVFSPLDKVKIKFSPPYHDFPKRIDYISGPISTVKHDGSYVLIGEDGKVTQEGKMQDADIEFGSFSFMMGGKLGKDQLVLKFSSTNGEDSTLSTYITLTTETKIVTNNTLWNSFYPLMKELILKRRNMPGE